MKLIKTIAITFAAISIGSCSDGFLRNEPQGPLSEANMNDPKAVDLLFHHQLESWGSPLRQRIQRRWRRDGYMGIPRYGNG